MVETANLRTGYRGANPDTLRMTERFTRVAPNVVEWKVTVNDPSTWSTSSWPNGERKDARDRHAEF